MRLVVEGNRLVGVDHDRVITLSAAQISTSLSGEKIEVGDSFILVKMGRDIDDLTIMTRPLEPAVFIKDSDDRINAFAVVEILGERHTLENIADDHVIVGERWFPLDQYFLNLVRNWLSEKAPDGWMPLAQYPRAYENLGNELRLIDDVDDDAYRNNAATVRTPPGLKAALYPYQQTGFQWLAASCDAGIGGILGDEMGLGKTLQVIAMVAERAPRGLGPTLVIAPVTIIENWCRELSKFAPGIRLYVHRGPNRARYAGAIKDIDLVITSYDTAVNDLGLMLMVEWDVLVLDEAQYVKNPTSLRSSSLRDIPRRASVLMTGTPLENRTLDIWSLCEFAIPGYFGDQQTFESSVSESPELVEQALRPLMLRRKIADAAVYLPERTDIESPLEMFDEERAGYERLVDQLSSSSGNQNALARLTRLRQFTGHPGLLDEELLNDPMVHSAKLFRLIELLDEVFRSDQKALVFSTFTGLSDLISQTAAAHFGIPSVVMDGRTPTQMRQGVIDTFSGINGPALMVLHPQTGGVGLNITAANHVFHYTLEWNPQKENQGTARSHRLKQTQPVFVHRLFYVNSVDELILDALQAKSELFGKVVSTTRRIEVELLAKAMERKSTLSRRDD